MGLRDLAVLLIVLIGIPFIVRQPAVGVMYWVWISLMNPHRQAFGFAYTFPFAMLIAGLTLVGLVFTREPRQMKGGAPAVVLLLFLGLMCVSTMFALQANVAPAMLERVLKIQLFTFIALFVLYKREHVIWLVTTIVISIGYYGVKGGVFTLATGGGHIVWGPAESFIADNNALALAVVMSIPLWAYLFHISKHHWLRLALLGAMVLSGISALGSFSRGALLASAAMLAFLWLRGKQKALLGAALIVIATTAVVFMPSTWDRRMSTIGTYEEDASAQGRLNTWELMFNIAKDRPLGGGFEPYRKDILQRYKPDYHTVHSAHSIYFQVLGEHGFIGLGLFLLFWLLTWRIGNQIRKMTKGRPEEDWAFWLASMVQVSLVAYFVGGTFLNLAYWDMPYYLMVALVITRHAVLRARTAPSQVPVPQPAGAAVAQVSNAPGLRASERAGSR